MLGGDKSQVTEVLDCLSQENGKADSLPVFMLYQCYGFSWNLRLRIAGFFEFVKRFMWSSGLVYINKIVGL